MPRRLRLTKKTAILFGAVIVILSGALGYLLWRVNQTDTTAPTDSDAGITCPDGYTAFSMAAGDYKYCVDNEWKDSMPYGCYKSGNCLQGSGWISSPPVTTTVKTSNGCEYIDNTGSTLPAGSFCEAENCGGNDCGRFTFKCGTQCFDVACGANACTTAPSTVCGNGTCESGEDGNNCSLDCRPEICGTTGDLTVSNTNPLINTNITFNLKTGGRQANVYWLSFYNKDNLYGPGNPKPICIPSTGGYQGDCPSGSQQLAIAVSDQTTMRTSASITANTSNLFVVDKNWNDKVVENIQINGYFRIDEDGKTGATSLPNGNCVLAISLADPSCGDNICNGTENANSCPDDCASTCGDNYCTHEENANSCPDDCEATCGDNMCTHDESSATCPEDCGANCGDNVCNSDETALSCPNDCEASCGDNMCTHDETAQSCPDDCAASCGDGLCTHDETYASCPADCNNPNPGGTTGEVPQTGIFDDMSTSVIIGFAFIGFGIITNQTSNIKVRFESKMMQSRRSKLEDRFK